MEEHGYTSALGLSKATGVCPSAIGLILNLKHPGQTRFGKWYAAVQQLADFLKCFPEELFPPQHIRNPLQKNKAVLKADISDVAALTTSMRSLALPALKGLELEETKATVIKMLEVLNERERKIVESAVFDGGHPTAMAKEFGVSRSRANQMYQRALEKMQNRARAQGVGRETITEFDEL